MYSFLPKVAQQLGQLAKMNKNPYINNPNPPFEPPEAPGDIYKNLIKGGTSDSYYRKYNNEWTVYDNDNKGWKSLPPSYPEMLNNRISMSPAQSDEQYDNNEVGFDPRLYRQGNAEYKETSPIANVPMPDQTAGLGMFNVPITPKDMGGTGVLASDMPFPKVNTPELDMLMSKTEAPYSMDYTPFASEEEMNRYYNQPKTKFNPNDMGGAGVLAKTGPEPTPYFDQIMSNAETPYVPNYTPFISPEEMFKAEMNITPEPEIKLPVSLPPVPEELIPYPTKLEYKSIFDLGKSPDYLGMSNENIIIPEPDPYKSNEPEITLSNKTNITEPVTTKQNKFGTPEAYYLGKSMLDATALINNMVQPQPPSIQMKLPHYERQRLNPEPYDTMRSQIRDQGTQAYRLQRENISQASDLMKGLAAVTSGTQQGLMQVGMQQAGAEQQIQAINQQISMQEQAAQTQILNQEATTNYQIQAQAQQFKDQMISAQLARLGDTAGAYAKYANMKDIATKQDLVNKAAIQSTNEIQNAMLQYQLQKDAMDSDEYKSAWSQHWNKSLDQLSIDKLSDEKYNLVKEYYGETTPSYGDFRRRATNPVFIQDYYQKRNAYDMFQKLYPGGIAPDRSKYSNDTDYNNALADFKKYEQDSKAYNDNKSYKTFEQEQDFWTTLSKEKNETAERKKFADQYMKDRGIFTSEQLMESIQASLDRSRQSLEIGG